MTRRLGMTTCAIALVAVSSGHGQANRAVKTPTSHLGYVGRVSGTSAYVGIVVRAGQTIAYVCDGRTLARWFKGSPAERSFVLKNVSGDELSVRLTGAGARGVLRIHGTPPHPFIAAPATGRAGLYRLEERILTSASATPADVLSGWVRLNDGSVRGAALTSPLRTLQPAPDIEVQLLPAQPPSIVPAGALPQIGNRQTGDALVCRTITTRGCGLPLAVPPPARNTPARIVARPPQIDLSQAALSALTAGIDGAFERARTAFLRRAGRTEPALPPAAQATANAAAAAMRADPALLAAAEQLRRARTAAEAAAKSALYAGLLKHYTSWLSGVGRGYDLAAVFSAGARAPSPTNVERSLTGPWLIIDSPHGDGDWDTSNDLQLRLGVAGDVLTLDLHAGAGFNSEVRYTRYAVVSFDVPANATNVEVEIDRSGNASFELSECGGFASGHTWEGYMIYRVGSNGINLSDDPLAGGFGLYDHTGQEGEGQCGLVPPVPDPDHLQVVEPPLPFTVPAQGGKYDLVVIGEAGAAVALGGTAVTELNLAIEGITLRYRV